MTTTNHECVVVLDFGAINAQMAAKEIRAINIYCEVLPYTATIDRIQKLAPKAIVLQRGAACGERTLGLEATADIASLNLPIVDLAENPCTQDALTTALVAQAGLKQDWTTECFINESIAQIREQVGDKHALLALSGGVDSSVCAALLHKALGPQLTCVFVDHGFMRKDEPKQVSTIFRDQLGVNLIAVDAEQRYLDKLKGVTEPETKRKIIGEEFIRIFEEEARKLGQLDYFVQGTIYPDIIESGWDGGKAVKSHHNVGGLPERIDFKGIIEPLKYLFKDEVRRVGSALGLPEYMVQRQPFPGPGLAVRCLGELTKDKLDTLRDADAIFRDAMAKSGYEKDANQFFAVLTGLRSVGVKDDARTYGYTVALRAVKTTDFMTAKFVELPFSFLAEVSAAITDNVADVNRIVYDITSKPPSTIEWE